MFKNNIAKLRKNLGKYGLSQGQLAEKLGVNRAYVSRMENNKQLPSPRIMFEMASIFACSVEDIYEYTKDKKI